MAGRPGRDGTAAARPAAPGGGFRVGEDALADRGVGTVLSFEVADADAADEICAHVRGITHATSLGGVESTIERRAKLPGQDHVPAGLVRLSIGCEHVEDLWTDLAATLDATAAVATTPDDTAHQPARQDSTAWSHP